ncbi:NAD(P)H-binding protein, partial [Stenotrophomonas maltophilia]|uniref:NAD(P)H-binding protein n=1 Tax=Stenotrophomonas maltophilia TaxID=40324 RepID=UPI0013DD4FC2
LASAMRGCDAVVFSAGAGGRDSDAATTHVDGDGPAKVAAAAKLAGIRRFVLVSVFPEAWRERRMDAS